MSWDDEDLAELEELRDEEWAPLGPALVCRCFQVPESEIEALAAAGCDADEIGRRTGASTQCGSCRHTVEAIVRLCGGADR